MNVPVRSTFPMLAVFAVTGCMAAPSQPTPAPIVQSQPVPAASLAPAPAPRAAQAGLPMNPQTAPVASPQGIPFCRIDRLQLTADGADGDFNGMSHGGTYLILRNTTQHTCQAPPFPTITLADATHALAATAEIPGAKFMHPGPVVIPAVLAPGAESIATMTWISGPVFPDSVCINPKRLTLTSQNLSNTIDFGGNICGDRSKGVTFNISRFSLRTK